MTTPSDFLGGLTPIEVLVGEAPAVADVASAVREFLKQDDDLRLRTVLDAAANRASHRESV